MTLQISGRVIASSVILGVATGLLVSSAWQIFVVALAWGLVSTVMGWTKP